jgi:peptidoglycan DL-endopeptidase CwlO
MKFVRSLLLVLIIAFVVMGVNKVGTDKPPRTVWTVSDSKAYARDKVLTWADKQWVCLDKLWTRESHWRTNAYNKVKVMGKNAGGIPQLLDLNPKVPATMQIDRGISYIIYRYKTPCNAWYYHQKHGWY